MMSHRIPYNQNIPHPMLLIAPRKHIMYKSQMSKAYFIKHNVSIINYQNNAYYDDHKSAYLVSCLIRTPPNDYQIRIAGIPKLYQNLSHVSIAIFRSNQPVNTKTAADLATHVHPEVSSSVRLAMYDLMPQLHIKDEFIQTAPGQSISNSNTVKPLVLVAPNPIT